MNKCYDIQKSTFMQRLFPAKFPPEVNAEFKCEDEIIVRSTTTLSAIDRIRILWSGKIVCVSVTATEKKPGRVISESVSWVAL